jgi:Spy/CpxP family protein refolding chaperone
MNMKQLMMGLALAVFTMGAAQAQDAPKKTMADRVDARTERMVKELGLNADQAAKVKEINAKYADQGKELHQQRKEGAEREKGEMAKIRDARWAELKQVLTPEQYEKCVANEKKQMAEMQERRQEKRQDKQPVKAQ